MVKNNGLIHVYYGDGKGKTTAALGLAVRALGSGLRVVFVQFMKNQATGELSILNGLPGVTVLRGKEGSGFSFSMTEEEKEKTRLLHNENLKAALALAASENYDMLILDEAVGAYDRDLIDRTMLEEFVRTKPERLELVLTGRNPAQWMIGCADYASEIRKIKHPYDEGIPARVGIEK
ncbi:MAG TPA: cob(I)yrinic acid a,c-diamide adenosyltransferase [Anaerovoracaceae bacterium]|nr:cob(I)yrinic acid a,c-diamide adenosyltransferase [Anaerovoracaceae bacterium]